MILDPDQPRTQERTDRQSLIATDRGWTVIGQPTEAAEVWVKNTAADFAALIPAVPERERFARASVMALELIRMGRLTDG